jgi:hypothetical protein
MRIMARLPVVAERGKLTRRAMGIVVEWVEPRANKISGVVGRE